MSRFESASPVQGWRPKFQNPLRIVEKEVMLVNTKDSINILHVKVQLKLTGI
jgi:hypothetical protein